MKTSEHSNHESLNYWTPLTSQVEALEKPIPSPPPPTPKVQFTLSNDHRETNGWKWRHQEVTRIRNGGRRRLENSTQRRRRRAKAPLTDEQIKSGIIDGTIASAISDTGATSTAGTTDDPFEETDQISTKVFTLPTGGTAAASKEAKLLIDVRSPANKVDIVPNLEQTLLSTSKFADAGYTAVYDDEEVNFYEKEHVKIDAKAVLKGYRCPKSRLWRVPLTKNIVNENTDTIILDSPCGQKSTNKLYHIESSHETREHIRANMKRGTDYMGNVYELPSIEHTIRYLHASAGYPTKETWLKAIRQPHSSYSTWPLVNVKNVNKHFPESEETQKGHMKSQRQGVRSTKITPKKQEPQETQQEQPTENDIIIRTYDTNDTMYTDQTGKFPHTSSRGNRYQMILFHVASNSIWVEPTKNKTEGEMILARQRALQRMKLCGIIPKRQVLDNEASAAYRTAIKESNMEYQLVPPDDHRRNVAEKAIQTWKDHFIANLSGTADTFPLHLWDQCIPQMERQLNLLSQSNANPKISTYAHLYGHHDYNAMPFVPIGMETLVHDRPHRRKSFAEHCSKGWVLGTSPEHYRCWKVHSKDTNANRISGRVFFKHKYITNPSASPEDAVMAAAANLASVLKNNVKQQHFTMKNLKDLKRLEKILSRPATSPRVQAPTAISPRVTTAESPRVSNAVQDNESADDMAPELVDGYESSDDEEDEEETEPQRSWRTGERIAPSPRVNDDSPPAHNTRSQVRTIMQETMLRMINIQQPNFSPKRAASRKYPKEALAAVLNEETGELMEYRHLIANPKYRPIWKPAYGKEIGRLAQGIPGVVEGTNTMVFIPRNEVPEDRWRDVTYGRICANYRPEKDDPYRIRLTVGGNLIHFPGDCGTPTADMLTVKMLLNSIISTKGAKCMTIDIKNFYLNTPMERPEYMRLKVADMPDNIIEQYNLKALETKDGYVLVRIERGMYGLPQAGIIAQELLEKRLNAKGYRQSEITPGFWTHDWRPISFSLVVDDFCVKYVGEEHANHLLEAIKEKYETSHEWEATRYIGLTIEWDYKHQLVHISMPEYITKALQRFQHTMPKKRQDQPYPHTKVTYGAKQQYTETEDTSPAVSKEEKTFIQEVIGTLLYYARAVDCTMLCALGSLASQQAQPTERTMQLVKQLLDYAASNPDAVVTYRKSDMVLALHSDASYLSETKARSRAGGHFFCSEDKEDPPNNGAVLAVSQIIKAVMSSAAEAELGALYINAREAVPMRHLLEELGHKQPPTPIQVDNSTACGVVNKTIQPKRTKPMDMRFHWLRCRENQKQFRTYWRAGPLNNGDYTTKHHATIHHRAMRPVYLTSQKRLAQLRARAMGIIHKLVPTARVC